MRQSGTLNSFINCGTQTLFISSLVSHWERRIYSARGVNLQEHLQIQTSGSHHPSKQIWKLEVPEKLQYFTWRTLPDCLPTKGRAKFLIHMDPICALCKQEIGMITYLVSPPSHTIHMEPFSIIRFQTHTKSILHQMVLASGHQSSSPSGYRNRVLHMEDEECLHIPVSPHSAQIHTAQNHTINLQMESG